MVRDRRKGSRGRRVWVGVDLIEANIRNRFGGDPSDRGKGGGDGVGSGKIAAGGRGAKPLPPRQP